MIKDRKKWAFALLVLALTHNVRGDADPEAKADPVAQADPEPQADPQADPQYYQPYSRPPYNPMPWQGSRPPYNQGGSGQSSACELTNTCCGINNLGCCAGGQTKKGVQCRTIWERKCDTDPNPECQVVVQRVCKPFNVKDCRVERKVEYRDFPAQVCTPKPLTKCFTYQRKVCTPATDMASTRISWINQMLETTSSRNETICGPVQGYNCTSIPETSTVKQSRRVPVTRVVRDRQCRMVPVPGVDRTIKVPVANIQYRQQCYTVKVPECNNCGVSPTQPQSSCGVGQYSCSLNQYSTVQSCPFAQGGAAGNIAVGQTMGGGSYAVGTGVQGGGFVVDQQGGDAYLGVAGGQGGNIEVGRSQAQGSGFLNVQGPSPGDSLNVNLNRQKRQVAAAPFQTGASVQSTRPPFLQGGGGCRNVREPLCGAAVGGTCRPRAQQCCYMKEQRVCQQVPFRSVSYVDKVVPGQGTWRQECNDYERNVTDWKIEYIDVPVTKNRTDCKKYEQQQCQPFQVPIFTVTAKPMDQTVQVPVPACKSRLVTDKYCHTFPTGDIECRTQSIRRGFTINRIVCDRDNSRPFCFNVPSTICRLGQNVNCKMVPRQDCRETSQCSSNPICNTCNNFIQSPSYGTCQSGTCGTFYGSNPFDNFTAQWNGASGGQWGNTGVYPFSDGYTGGLGMNYQGTGGSGVYPGGFGGNGITIQGNQGGVLQMDGQPGQGGFTNFQGPQGNNLNLQFQRSNLAEQPVNEEMDSFADSEDIDEVTS